MGFGSVTGDPVRGLAAVFPPPRRWRVIQDPSGTVTVLGRPKFASLFIAAFLVLWGAVGVWGRTTPHFPGAMMPLVFGIATLWLVGQLIIRDAWTFAPRQVRCQTRVLPTSLGWGNDRYLDVAAIELRRGVWASGEGYSDALRLRRSGDRPVELRGLFDANPAAVNTTIEEQQQILGRFIAARVGVP